MEDGRKLKKGVRENLREVENPPNGFDSYQLEDVQLLKDCEKEVEDILACELSNQIASNQHFFLNLPFPLSHSREANTPSFAYTSTRVPALARLVLEVFRLCQCSQKEIDSMLPRANVIVREYRPGQQIAFHVDELECDAEVFGCIIRNDHPTNNGLLLRKGEGNVTLNYTVKEQCGTVFYLRDEARYKWKHGLPPCEARRISVTIRIFKQAIIKKFNQQLKKDGADAKQEDSKEEATTTAERTAGSNATKCRIQICKNSNRNLVKPAVFNSPVDIKELKKLAKNKLTINAKNMAFYLANGTEVVEGSELADDVTIYVTCGENFGGAKQQINAANLKLMKSKASTQEHQECIFGQPLIQQKIQWWSTYTFGRLAFRVIKSPECEQQDPEAKVVDTMNELGLHLQKSHLTIPEFRELIHSLHPIVAEKSNNLWWTFRSSVWTTGRNSVVGIKYWIPPDSKEKIEGKVHYHGQFVEFEAEGVKAYKGSKKRDGEIWTLEGGFNNPYPSDNSTTHSSTTNTNDNASQSEKKPRIDPRDGRVIGDDETFSEEASTSEEELDADESNGNLVNHLPSLDADLLSPSRIEQNIPLLNHKKNKYQKKRGVVFTPDYVFFAGTVWCSALFSCRIVIDQVVYSSATQYVLAQQATLFKDDRRLKEIMASNFDSSTHKAYDSKSLKSSQRKGQHFDSKTWEEYRLRLMWRATCEKFCQNQGLKNRMLQTVGNRVFVEATDDAVWGIGLSLDNHDCANPAKWKAANCMGVLLTGVYRLILMEENSKSFTLERIDYLRDLAAKATFNTAFKERLLGFVKRVTEQSGDADRFPVPGWTNAKSALAVKEYLLTRDDIELESLLAQCAAYIASTLTEEQRKCYAEAGRVLPEKSGVDEEKDVDWHRSLLHCLEGALELRKF